MGHSGRETLTVSSVQLDGNTRGRDAAVAAEYPVASVPTGADGVLLGRIGSLEVRLAQSAADVAAAQAIRFDVFVRELGACTSRSFTEDRDADDFDEICDHLLVVDTAAGEGGAIVGTYRLLPQERATRGFYSDSEFELTELVARHPGRRFLELGRSCVLPDYRSKRTIELLWQGIWSYCRRNSIDVMVGCASFHGIEPVEHAQALSLLAHNFQTENEWHVRARCDRFSEMKLLRQDELEPKAALTAMPPLIKGYLRLGAKFGEGCVVDTEFETTDVLVVLPVENIPSRYIEYYTSGPEAGEIL
ncbi:hypothetical protein GCM10011385_10030 [Nitratireductor aestuarii]|uniref:L-ornithine N(alpha)-acyltransferase n=1 Tax=Nitratireductor aestuarii TaxID=1735103 RepID=A0A916W1E1_9HYPH|nr:hypothetical protein GCM10011385_10030 [Nitratireductor aestuarii]